MTDDPNAPPGAPPGAPPAGAPPGAPGNGNPAPSPAAPAAAARPTQRVIAQYVRDLSFENVLARKGLSGDLSPEIAVQVSLDGKKRGTEGSQYEVATKLVVTSKAKASGEVLFALEVEYVGVFQIEGVPDEQVHPYLLVECPRITFPFLRRIVSDVTRDGGFPPLNLEVIDFVALYRAEIARRAGAAKAPRLDA